MIELKKKVEDLFYIIKSPNKRNFNLNENGKINSILSTNFQKINIKIKKINIIHLLAYLFLIIR